MKFIFCTLPVLFLLAHPCTSSAESTKPSCPTVPQGYDVWKLAEMAENRDSQLETLFNNGAQIDQLPSGYAAGAAARVMNLNNSSDLAGSGLVDLPDLELHRDIGKFTMKNWRGKIFFPCEGCSNKTEGVNRIREFVIFPGDVKPMAGFVTEVLDPRTPGSDPHMKRLASLVPNITSNIIVLNYAKPQTGKSFWARFNLEPFGNWLGGILQTVSLDYFIHVYDVVAKIKGGGAYGPEIYIGKTFWGHYDSEGHFYPVLDKDLIAWFFLDFSPCALEAQSKRLAEEKTDEIRIPENQIPILKSSPARASF